MNPVVWGARDRHTDIQTNMKPQLLWFVSVSVSFIVPQTGKCLYVTLKTSSCLILSILSYLIIYHLIGPWTCCSSWLNQWSNIESANPTDVPGAWRHPGIRGSSSVIHLASSDWKHWIGLFGSDGCTCLLFVWWGASWGVSAAGEQHMQ